jgi:hypothetical protein
MMFDGLDDYETELTAESDLERPARLDAERVTWEFRSQSTRRIDAGRAPIIDSPLFGGPRQQEMF